MLRVRGTITSHFRIPPSGHLGLSFTRKILSVGLPTPAVLLPQINPIFPKLGCEFREVIVPRTLRTYRWLISLLLVMSLGSWSEPLRGEDQPLSRQPSFQSIVETETTAQLLAILLDSGRNVVNENQHLINDPEKRDKGFTPEVFEQQLMEIFWQRSGINLQELGAEHIPEQAMVLLPQLVEMSKQVIDEGQSEINRKGLGFKGFIPAVFGARVAGRFSAATDVLLGQRALVPRNPSNLPDPFERAALLAFADLAYPKEKIISEVAADNHWLRLMLPLYTTRGCLDCHGQPKGEIDKTGYPREGLQLGQNAGGISVLIPVQE